MCLGDDWLSVDGNGTVIVQLSALAEQHRLDVLAARTHTSHNSQLGNTTLTCHGSTQSICYRERKGIRS